MHQRHILRSMKVKERVEVRVGVVITETKLTDNTANIGASFYEALKVGWKGFTAIKTILQHGCDRL